MGSFELSGSVSDKDKAFVETWENVSESVNYIIRENRRGDEEPQAVTGMRQFKLTTYDRMLTEDKIYDQRHNPFKNGSFRPVIVPEDVNIESNPNAMSADDIRSLFKASDMAWEEYMDVITSPATLKRMLDMADNGEGELSHKRYKQLDSMHEQHGNHGKPILAQNDPEIAKMAGSPSEPATVTTRGPGRPRKAS